MEHRCFTFHMDKVIGLKRDTWSASGNSPVCYQSFLISGVWYGGKSVVGSVGNMLVSSVTRLPVLLSWLVMEGMSKSGLVVVEMEVVYKVQID